MPKLLVIADDLTGAADTGARLAAQGVATLIVIDSAAAWPEGAADCRALVVNTESRHLNPQEAAGRVASAAERGAALGATHFYKKTDSTLRGNVGAELEALRAAVGRGVLPYLPAYPRLGRTTSGGTLYVSGSPLRETAFAADPLAPVGDSFVPSIIAAQTGTPCLLVDASSRTESLPAQESGAIWLFDAETDEDLCKAGEFLERCGLLAVTAGSAGFAAQLPRLLGLEAARPSLPRASGPLLVAAGSLNEVALAQLASAEAAGFASVTLPPSVLACEGGARTPQGREAAEEILAHAHAGCDVIVRSVGGAGDFEPYLEQARSNGFGGAELHALVSENMAGVVAAAVEGGEFGALVVLGGDTMLAVAHALGWVALLSHGEVMPGVAVSEVQGRAGSPPVVSKAGGFGGPDVLTEVRELLREGTE